MRSLERSEPKQPRLVTWEYDSEQEEAGASAPPEEAAPVQVVADDHMQVMDMHTARDRCVPPRVSPQLAELTAPL
jgi:hypothetical protein